MQMQSQSLGEYLPLFQRTGQGEFLRAVQYDRIQRSWRHIFLQERQETRTKAQNH